MDIAMDVLEIVLKILTFYTAVIGVCFIIPCKKIPIAPSKTKFAVLIAARNEAAVITAIIESLQKQNYPKELYDIIVIPNNCTDNTEEVAQKAGAKIMHCPEPVSTKGEVLHQILEIIHGQYDAYIVFDADNIVHPDFLARMNDAVVSGAKVAKSRQCALNPYDNWVSGSYDLYFHNIHWMHSRARMPFGLSAKLIGTGFMVTDELMEEMGGWNTVTLTEDIEFACMCAEKSIRVQYVPDAMTYDEEPLSFVTSLRQRRRWSAGVQSTANRYAAKLLFTKKPNWMRWDLAIHVSMIYVQLLALIPVLYHMIGMPIADIAVTLGISLGSFWLGSALLGLFIAIISKRNICKMWSALLLYPLYLASWYPMHIWGLISKPKVWKPIEHGTAVKRETDEMVHQ